MRTRHEIRTALRRNLPVLVGLSLCLYFSYHCFSGERSYGRLSQLENSLRIKSMHLVALEEKVAEMESVVVLLRPNSLSPDMVDEQARYILGYQAEDEVALLGN